MRVFISHAHGDLKVAKVLESELRQRDVSVIGYDQLSIGQDISVGIDELIESSKLTVVLVSKLAENSRWVRKEIEVALKAWGEEKLFLVRIGDATLPLGLRDLQVFQISDPLDRDQIANAAREIELGVRGSSNLLVEGEDAIGDSGVLKPQAQPSARSGYASTFLWGLIAITSSLAVIAIGLPGLLYVLEALGLEDGTILDEVVKAYWPDKVWAYGIPVLAIQLIAVLAQYRFSASALNPSAAELDAKSTGPGQISVNAAEGATVSVTITEKSPDIFTSYSRKNLEIVDEIVVSMRESDLIVWIDREKQSAKQRYAKALASAMRSAQLVVVVCSKPAFQSDHVAREIYLAGHMKKSFVLIILEDLTIPDEFCYFLTGFHQIDLSETPLLDVGSRIRHLLDA